MSTPETARAQAEDQESTVEGACPVVENSKAGAELSPVDFSCLLGAFLFFRLPWLFMLPMNGAPDEFAHHWVIKFLSEHWRLPSAAEVQAGGASAVYGSLPQLGYIPHILAASLAPADMLALSERFGSIAAGAVMLFAAFRTGGILFPGNRVAALALPASVVCHPQLAFIHAYANNDSTSSALASLLLWLALETVKRGICFKRTLGMGALAGWLALTKYSGLAVMPVVGFALLASVFLHRTGLIFAGGALLGAAMLGISLSLWWFLQNAREYPGDFMGTQTMYRAWAQTFHRDLHYYLPASHIIKSLRWWRLTFFSYWALFGYMTVYVWRPVYFVYLGMVLSAVLGWLNAMRKFITNRREFSASCAIIWSCLALTLCLNIASMIWASVYNYGGPQGRYLITSEIPIMALIIGGLNLLGGRAGKWLTISFVAFNALVSAGSFFYLFRLYGGWHLNPL